MIAKIRISGRLLLCLGLLCSARVFGGNAEIFESALQQWQQGDQAGAIEGFRKLAGAGHMPSQFRLGLAYETGYTGGSRDLAAAEHWYRLAAEQGHAEAQSRLGDLLFDGHWLNDVHQDLDAAMYWQRRAAEQGIPNAQFRLGGLLCLRGNQPEGYAWLWLARSNGHGGAVNELERVCKSLTPQQQEQARQLAADLGSKIDPSE